MIRKVWTKHVIYVSANTLDTITKHCTIQSPVIALGVIFVDIVEHSVTAMLYETEIKLR